MFSLHRQKTLITFISFFVFNSVWAQEDLKFQPDYDAKRIHFGYFLGVASTHYQVRFNSSFIGPTNNGRVLAITSPTTTGIKAGGIINVHLNDYFDFRFSPLSVAIYNRKILENDSIVHKQEDKAWFEIPLLLKYKSERRKNTRMFMFGGLKYGFETNIINKRGGVSTRNVLFTKTSDLTLDYGFGLEIFREYFKVTPEIHFSHGLKNMKATGVPASSYMQYVDRLRTHSVTFFLVFQ